MTMPSDFDAWLTTNPNEAIGFEEHQYECPHCGHDELIEFEVHRDGTLTAECPECEAPIEHTRDELI